MMRVVDIRPVEDCFDEDLMREIHVSEPMNEKAMYRLARSAVLDYHPHFPKPYFRIEKGGSYVIQGVLGNNSFRVTASRAAGREVWNVIRSLIEKGE